MEVQKQNSQQHQYRSGQGVEEELDGGVEFPRPAPYPDQQIHRHQHRFPEHKEEEEIQRHEDAQHARLQKQKPDVVFLHPILDRGPRRKDRDPSQQRRQHDQQKRNAVDAQDIARADRRDPVARAALDELEARLEAFVPEHRNQRDRDQKAGERKKVRDPADRVLILLRDKQENQRPQQRREKNDR